MNTNQILNKVRTLLGMEVVLETMKLDDGITVVEAESFEAEKEIVVVTEDEQKIPLPVGEYETEDGRKIIVKEEGVIAEMKDKEEKDEEKEEEKVDVEEEEEAKKEDYMSENSAQTIKKTIESVVKETFFAEMEALKKENEELKAKLEGKVEVELSEEEVEPIVFNPENVQKFEGYKFGSKGGNSIMNNILNKLNK